MKQLFCQLLIFVLIIFSNVYCSGEAVSLSWGYIVHTDKLPDAYLNNVMNRYAVVSITGFILDDSGTLTTPSGSTFDALKALSGKSSASVYPIISFKTPSAGRRLLSSKQAQLRAARNIASCAGKNKFKGIHLDFEYLPPEDAPRLGSFLDQLRRKFRGVITLAVFPQVDFPQKWSGFHDLSVISPRVDQLVIMCYDLHGIHTGPGPVTDVRWAEKNILHALAYVDASKVWLGVPAYGYRWCGNHAVAVSSKQGIKEAASHTVRRDPSGCLSYESGNSCITYLSDLYTRSLLSDLARRYGLAGTALWRIGFEE
jgi:spore germination protein YaaH